MKPFKNSPKVKEQDFMCVCSPRSKARAEAIYHETLRRLGTTPDKLLSAVVYSLHWELDAWIKEIGCDQWCGVSAEGMAKGVLDMPVQLEDGDPDKITSYIQCDAVEHGIAATWLYFAQLKDADLAKYITRKGYIRRTKVRAIDPVKDYEESVGEVWSWNRSVFDTMDKDERMAEQRQRFADARRVTLDKYGITNEQLIAAAEYVRFYSLEKR